MEHAAYPNPGERYIRIPLVAKTTFPPYYSAYFDALNVVIDKGRRDIKADVEHARGCGCSGCIRRANMTHNWYFPPKEKQP